MDVNLIPVSVASSHKRNNWYSGYQSWYQNAISINIQTLLPKQYPMQSESLLGDGFDFVNNHWFWVFKKSEPKNH